MTLAEIALTCKRTPYIKIDQPDGSVLIRRSETVPDDPWAKAERWGVHGDEFSMVDWVFPDGSRIRDVSYHDGRPGVEKQLIQPPEDMEEFKKLWNGDWVWDLVGSIAKTVHTKR